ncbi:MAG: hypothetical protein RJA81_223 [Planctomycetota bacterium]
MNTLAINASRKLSMDSSETIPVKEMVRNASNIVAPVWPLKTFIAVNPLQGLEDLPFEQAVRMASQIQSANRNICPEMQSVNRETIKWCSTYFDEGQATIPMPGQAGGLYHVFKDLARYDARLTRFHSAGELLKALPDSPDQAIKETLDHLRIPSEQREEFVRQNLATLPGWAGYVKWKEHWQAADAFVKRPATLVDYVAMRLILTRLFWPKAQLLTMVEDHSDQSVLSNLPSHEKDFQNRLLDQLLPQAESLEESETKTRPDAQLLFCIDVRSEPFRRSVEAQGNYETLGFAGFFGLPVQLKQFENDQAYDSCPVLLKPRHLVCEQASASLDSQTVRRHQWGSRLLQSPKSFYQWLKYNFATPFALVELIGPWLGLRMLGRTIAPSIHSEMQDLSQSTLAPQIPTEPVLDDIDIVQQANYGESMLRMTGLTENLARLVVLCGHGSRTENNVYASALDCGACGGNHGGTNARIMAAILNRPDVREILAQRSLIIPKDTIFIAAEHETTTDHVEIVIPPDLSESSQSQLEQLRRSLVKARIRNAKNRVASFGLPDLDDYAALVEVKRRSHDWSEVRPEWGLARNAAFVVGPRKLTDSVNLEGRCFLHSYDWKTDPDGQFLTTILTAPMVVAQWINSQYFFSSLDNVAYGSGSKITQNLTGKMGVMQGNASDLMHGLPLQSVFQTDDEPYHEPLRLLTVVLAPPKLVESIVQKQEVLKRLFGNGWVKLVCIDPVDHRALLLNRDLEWKIPD